MLSFFRAAALVYLGLCVLMYLAQRRLVYFPSRAIVLTPGDMGMQYEDVALRTEDGVRIHAWFVPGDPDKATILFCHGNGGNLSHRVDTARVFHELGYSSLLFDYRGYGLSEGKPTEAGTYRDAAAAWDHLIQTRGLSARQIVVAGRSLGGAVAAWLAKERHPAALVLESSFSSFVDMGRAAYPIFPVRLLARFRYDTTAYAKEAGCPVLVIHSPQDDIVPYKLGCRLYDALPQPKEFLDIRGSHNDGYAVSGPMYTRGLADFLDRQLSPTPPPKRPESP